MTTSTIGLTQDFGITPLEMSRPADPANKACASRRLPLLCTSSLPEGKSFGLSAMRSCPLWAVDRIAGRATVGGQIARIRPGTTVNARTVARRAGHWRLAGARRGGSATEQPLWRGAHTQPWACSGQRSGASKRHVESGEIRAELRPDHAEPTPLHHPHSTLRSRGPVHEGVGVRRDRSAVWQASAAGQ